MRTKHAPLKIKTVPSDGSGEFTGLASTFGGEPDWQGDVVARGAFVESIDRWRKLGDLPPVGLNHDYSSASSRIGKLTSMQEIDEGLLVTGQLNLKSEAALAAYEALLTGALDAMSIGYAVLEQHRRDDGVNVLTKLDLIEVSFTPVPANPRARVLSVKSLDDRPDADRDLAARIDELELSTMQVSGKRRQSVPYEDDEIGLREHLIHYHANQVSRDAVLRMSLSELRTLHAVVHPDRPFDVTEIVNPGVSTVEKAAISREVDKLIASVRGEKQKEQDDADWFNQQQLKLLAGPIDWQLQDEREADRRAREDEVRAQREVEREQERQRAELRDEVSRTRNWHGDAYWESVGADPLPRTESAPMPEVRITDGTLKPDRFALPAQFVNVGEPIPTAPYTSEAWNPHRNLPVDDRPVEGAIHGEGETGQVPMAAIDSGDRKFEEER